MLIVAADGFYCVGFIYDDEKISLVTCLEIFRVHIAFESKINCK